MNRFRIPHSLKALIVVIALSLQLFSSPLRASDPQDKKVTIGLNFIGILFPWIEARFGVLVHPHFRINVDPSFFTWAYGSNQFSVQGFGGTLSSTIFFDEGAGWYIEPGVFYSYFRNTHSTKVGVHFTFFQAIMGYENVWKSGFFINFGMGPALAMAYRSEDKKALVGRHFFPLLTFNSFIGYRF